MNWKLNQVYVKAAAFAGLFFIIGYRLFAAFESQPELDSPRWSCTPACDPVMVTDRAAWARRSLACRFSELWTCWPPCAAHLFTLRNKAPLGAILVFSWPGEYHILLCRCKRIPFLHLSQFCTPEGQGDFPGQWENKNAQCLVPNTGTATGRIAQTFSFFHSSMIFLKLTSSFCSLQVF